ncbi:MAG: calcium-translocating P-type ATPase, PMCA-type [Gomphosphaeria aponina SAG 52.96 = DSM 107014]|uniref:P-type Ca(2+) transporter n=1 Tax=Gomphosphaeria aponina SAG 52.96 = DSM 107014 TaxID=1521640 RepID=A0A941JS63_9CHRO|nr:calcium-translocating P-type ATPase, PMCA-type [Gomphosphaeria aponina SAG 52.96 = DSM 107014]
MEVGKKNAHIKGLTQEEVEESRQKYGANILTPAQREAWWKLWLEKFDDPIIRILIVAAIISIAVGVMDDNYVEGLGIILAIILATTLAFINEYKANKEFNILQQTNDEEPIEVIRDCHYTTVPKKDLVVGDLVVVEIGQEIPADGSAIEAVSLQINEAKLTGEAAYVRKYTKAQQKKYPESESTYPPDKVLRGTMVMEGNGIIEITAVGDRTEIGEAAREISIDSGVETPLNIQLERLSKLIGVLGFSVAVLINIALVGRGILTDTLNLTFGQWYVVALVFVSLSVALIRIWLPMIYDGLELRGGEVKRPSWLEKDDFQEWLKTGAIGLGVFVIFVGIGIAGNWISKNPADWLPIEVANEFLTYFMIAVAVIVVAVPEGLALSVTLSLAYSMQKMAKQNNLVRQMHACETMGAITVICSDKTGTLTLNEMRVKEASFPSFAECNIEEGKESEAEKLIVEALCVNSTANLEREAGKASIPLGNPTEAALLLWVEEWGIDYIQKRAEFVVKDQLTFTTERKYMATFGRSATGKDILHVKGAPEVLLEQCGQYLSETGVKTLGNDERKAIEAEVKGYQARGRRTLGFAYGEEITNYTEGVELQEQKLSLIWLGVVAIADPIRKEVPQAIAMCREAGVEVKMVTGDSTATAEHIAREIGILEPKDSKGTVIAGPDFRALDYETALFTVQKLKVIARARPKDKQRLVELLQDAGEVVAVTGDGTNDAPALKQAQVGLAMGKIGTDVAKEASDIIILDDSFTSIENAVMWGRSLYQNIQKFVLFQLTINVAACGLALLGPFIGINLPFTVIQLLWVNLIMDTFAALALATEPPNLEVMKVPPRDPEEFIISKAMTMSIFTVAPIFLVLMVVFLLVIQKDGVISPNELTLFFTTFVMLQVWNIFNAKCFGTSQSVFSNLLNNWSFLAIVGGIFFGQIIIVQFGGKFFRTVPLSWENWLLIIGITSVVLWVGEIWRLYLRLQFPASSS